MAPLALQWLPEGSWVVLARCRLFVQNFGTRRNLPSCALDVICSSCALDVICWGCSKLRRQSMDSHMCPVGDMYFCFASGALGVCRVQLKRPPVMDHCWATTKDGPPRNLCNECALHRSFRQQLVWYSPVPAGTRL